MSDRARDWDKELAEIDRQMAKQPAGAGAKPATAALRRQNRRTTLTRIIDLAEAERVDAILGGGDLFEHDRIAPDTVEFLRATFGRTAIPVYLAPGNHDWYSDASPYAVTEWSDNVHLFTEDRLTAVSLSDGITLWGAAHRAPANTDGFFATFRPDRSGIHLALAHASERGFLAQQGSGKMPHAPFEAAELEAAGDGAKRLIHAVDSGQDDAGSPRTDQ